MNSQKNSIGETVGIVAMFSDDIDDVLRIQTRTNLSCWKRSDYEREIKRNDSISLVAENDRGEVVGFIIVRLLMGQAGRFDSAEIFNIAVTDSFQRKGIGQMIFSYVKDKLLKKEIKEIWLEVRESNKKAIKFYKKNGFTKEFERKNYYVDPIEDAYILKIKL